MKFIKIVKKFWNCQNLLNIKIGKVQIGSNPKICLSKFFFFCGIANQHIPRNMLKDVGVKSTDMKDKIVTKKSF